jgi:hypothetical protein
MNPPEEWASSSTPPSTHKKGRGALLWGMGGTILSALGFVGLALFEQYNSMLSELRADLKHFNETSGELVKRESLQRFREHVKGRFKEVQESSATKLKLQQELRTSEKAREEMAHELQRMRERMSFLEGRQTASPIPPAPTPPKKETRKTAFSPLADRGEDSSAGESSPHDLP